MKKNNQLCLDVDITLKKSFLPLAAAVLGILLALTLWIVRLNSIAIVCAGYCCVISALTMLELIIKKRLNFLYFLGYIAASFGITMYYIVFGVDQSFGMRIVSNTLLALPSFAVIAGMYYVCVYVKRHLRVVMAITLNSVLILTSVVYVLTMNLKSIPKAFSLAKGHDDYLDNVKDTADSSSPNVLFIMMDDLGYGDLSCYGAPYSTPNIDSIAEDGLQFENFYSAYSVCSPSRFAALTGRYPYRGYADNVLYPTDKSYSPFAATRHYNSFEMGNNADGMLGDEITIAEALSASGYATAAIGKWHLGDYGQYLPTNQGFDYFYGSYQVNDMTPYYFVEEVDGESAVTIDTKTLKADQSIVTEHQHQKITEWITQAAAGDSPFFAYYASPWPHAPLSVGKAFDGVTGMGVYADCVTEFDYYLGELFQTMKDLGVYDNTIIIFTSDNGPALQGSTGGMRGGKYLAYDGGQKVPFVMKWAANSSAIGASTGVSTAVSGAATLTDLFPTLAELCGIESLSGKQNYLPSDVDRKMDGLSIVPMLTGEKDYVHDSEHPILHMKRAKIKALQYAIPTSEVIAATAELNNGSYSYTDYQVIQDNDYLQFKYLLNVQNDNSAFFDKFRKNWLHILTDDPGENYNRSTAYPEIADQMKAVLEAKTKQFKENRRGYYEQYYD